MFEAISAIFIILSVCLGIALYRSISRLSFYEDMYGDMYGQLGNLNENLLNDFDTLLDVSDNDLLSWILSKEIVPKAFDNEIFRRIVKFKENI